jgi:hypothetical protein
MLSGMADLEMLRRALGTVLSEVIDGPAADAAWLLNPEDVGLLRSLETLSAEQASAMPAGGGASIAAHVDHLRYGLGLLNRWNRGEQPFADANYSASWSRTIVTAAEWSDRLDDLRREAYAWRDALRAPAHDDANDVRDSHPHDARENVDREGRGKQPVDSDDRPNGFGGDSLRRGTRRWPDLTHAELTGVVSSIAHLAYHLGAIRQIDRATRGPAARD